MKGRPLISVEEFRTQLRERHPHMRLVSKEYLGTVKLHTFRCTRCGDKARLKPANVMKSKYGCGECSRDIAKENQLLERDKVEARIREHHGKNVRLMGQYRGTGVRHRFKCYVCLNTWKTQLNHVLRTGTGCPHCLKGDDSFHKRRMGRSFRFKELTIGGVDVRVQGYEPQAIEWLLANRKVKMKDLILDTSGDVPTISYKIGRRNHNYYPDIFIPKFNRIVEVKSTFTIGLLNGKNWRKNQQKAKACIAAGYKFTMMIMGPKGGRFWLPPDWYELTRKQVLIQCAFAHADHQFEGWQELFKESNPPRRRRYRRK